MSTLIHTIANDFPKVTPAKKLLNEKKTPETL